MTTTGAPPAFSLDVEGLSRRFGRRQVFTGVSGSVSEGQVMVVTGPNGSGKSTLLRIVAGLLPPTSGEVRLWRAGTLLNAEQRRVQIGYVAPDLILYAELSGVENLRFFGRLRGEELTRDQLGALLERVGLRGRGRDLVGGYSSGMRQRLKYAFALLHRPAVLLLDEPTANLDAQGVEIVKRIVAEQRQAGLTVIGTNEASEVGWGDTVVRIGAA